MTAYRSDAASRLDELHDDSFGHRDYAQAIETALDQVPSQFTLGLFGPWGSGKSTILNELSRRINSPAKPNMALALFDAWRYSGDSLRREFVREVGEQLKRHGALPRRFKVDRHVESFAVDVTRPRERLPSFSWTTLVSAALSAVFVVGVIATLYGLYTLVDLDEKTTVEAEIAVLGPIVAFILVVAGRLVSPVQIQESRRRFEFPEQFTENFRGLLDKVKVEKVVIAIDNLDRCTPERVAEVLSTIKTFLEPALEGRRNPGAKSLCFIIAADDEAVRRHLIAQEVSQSVSRAGGADARQAAVARDAVDEYLRKFFNASLRIGDVLDDDMRDFTTREMSDFFEVHGDIEQSVRSRLIELTAQGLKRNPRRLKQFVNNLELRLQLFSDRRAAGHILIEPDLLVVAKLAILEEEFPDEYLALRRDPGLLTVSHQEAEEKDPQEISDQLVGFLRFTNEIIPRDIVPYISLKQTKEELELPGYRSFIDLLDEANSRSLVATTAEDDPDLNQSRINAAGSHFDLMITRHAWDRTHNAARAILETPGLHGEGGRLAGHVLDRMLANPEARLLDLDPELVLRVGLDTLGSDRFDELLGAEINLIIEPDAEARSRYVICEALAHVADRLGTSSKQRLRVAFEADDLRGDFDAYAELAEAIPEIVGADTIREALSKLGSLEAFDSRTSAFQVAASNQRVFEQQPKLADELVAGAIGNLARLRAEPAEERFGELVEALLPVVAAAEDERTLLGLATDIQNSWDVTPGELRPYSLDLALAACDSLPAVDSELGESLGARAVDIDGTDEGREWIEEHLDLPSHFRSGLHQQLRAGLSGEGDDVERYRDIVSLLSEPEQGSLFAEAAREAVERGRFGVVEQLMSSLPGSEADTLVDEVAQRVEEAPGGFLDGDLSALNFILEAQGRLDEELVDRLATSLVDAFIDRRERAPELGPLLGRFQVHDAGKRLELVDRLIGFDRDVSNLNRREGILRCGYLIAGRYRSNARNAIEKRLDDLSRESEELANLVGRVRAA